MSWAHYNQPCIKCDSSDAMAIDSDGKGYCFSCQTYFSVKEIENQMPISTKPQQQQYSKVSVKEIQEYPIVALEDRGISEEAARFFGVRTSFNEQTGEPEYRYFPYYQGESLCYKRKAINNKKDQSFIGHTKGIPFHLFGRELTKGTNFLIITEGEEDTLAAWDMLRKNKKSYNVVSLPNGANINSIQENYNWLYEFTTINLAFDNDAPGKKAAVACAKIFDPGQVKVTEFKEFKDSNDYLKAGDYKNWLASIYNAVVKKPDGIVTITDIWEEAIRKPEWGKPWPWGTLTQATYGRRGGEIYGIGAGTGVN